jgi:hypothetical protein
LAAEALAGPFTATVERVDGDTIDVKARICSAKPLRFACGSTGPMRRKWNSSAMVVVEFRPTLGPRPKP